MMRSGRGSNGSALAPTHVVGIGASAGGLEAFTDLVKHLPTDTRMAFVLVQHLDPVHESGLVGILGRHTSMPVLEVKKSMQMLPDHVYVITPGTDLKVVRGVLVPSARTKKREPNRAVDHFFESLAADVKERAIGVVLSGAGNDGTMGLEAIRGEGGFTFAQDNTARHESMPRSAVLAGCVDMMLPPAGIAEELARIVKHPHAARNGEREPTTNDIRGELDRAEATAHEDDDSPLPSGGKGSAQEDLRTTHQETTTADRDYIIILALLHKHSGVDFSLYKSSTIRRRIDRRIVLSRLENAEAYAHALKGNAKELDALYSDVLISVTSFFRNPDAFNYIKKKVFPKIARDRQESPVRVWVLGCSTGQEAYSLAMTFQEFADKLPRVPKLQIFATDLNEALLEKARAGLYAKSLVNDVSPDRLRRFFVEEDGGYRVVKSLRESVVFARQNLLNDPPFSRMDLISCRNLLIYIDAALQKRAMRMFHYALKPHGCLFLGASESIGGTTGLFEPLDRKHKLFLRKPGPTPELLARVVPGMSQRETPPQVSGTAPRSTTEPEGFRGEVNAQREADRLTRTRYAPPSVLINADMQVLELRGDMDAYLKAPAGEAGFNVLKMAREGLMLPLRAAINKAKRDHQSVRKDNVSVRRNGQVITTDLLVLPLKNLKEPCYLIFFEQRDHASNGEVTPLPVVPPGKEAKGKVSNNANDAKRVSELESELEETRDYMRSLQEQHDAAQEELQAGNEEVTSANEELQSLNEELETSKEELESANEELTTINDEMAFRNAELHYLNSDLVNLQTSMHQAIVLVGRDLAIRRFSPQAEKLFNLLAGDVGRPLGNIRHDLVFSAEDHKQPTALEEMVARVITKVRATECEARDSEGRWYSLRVRPYITLDNKVDGAVLVLVDIDAITRAGQEIAAAQEQAEAVLRTTPEPMFILDADLRLQVANEAFYKTFHVQAADSEGRLIYQLGNGQWDIPAFRELLENLLVRKDIISGFEVTHSFEHIGTRSMLLNARRLKQAAGVRDKILVGIRDITAEKIAGANAAHLAAIITSSHDAIYTIDLDGIIRTWNQGAQTLFRYSVKEAVGKPYTLLVPKKEWDRRHNSLERIKKGEIVETYETQGLRKDGSLVDISLTISPIRGAGGQIIGTSKIARDITTSKATEEALRTVAHELAEADRRKNEFLAMLGHELRNPLTPVRAGLEVLRTMSSPEPHMTQVTNMIQRQVTQMVHLVDDLLDVSRVSRGKITLRKHRMELKPMLLQAIEAVRPSIEAAAQELVISMLDQPVYVEADPARLAQVVSNLLNNASKFTGRQGCIALSVEHTDKHVHIIVRDNGIGLSAEQLPRIFDLFVQADSSLERSTSGLGVGLTLVQKLVEMHGGTVEAHSPGVGQGSTFTVHLPVVQAPDEQKVAKPKAEGKAAPKHRRILVVDDNSDATDSIAMLLRHVGHEVHTAYDGIQGVEAADAHRPEVILMDIGLPRQNGYEAARCIREQAWGNDMFLIAITGWGQEEDRTKSREAGFDLHMVKPVDIAQLKELLAGHLVEGREGSNDRDS